jgi:DNA-binding transcriptional LysR family regulator
MYQLDNIKNMPPLEYLRSFVIFVESRNIVEAAQELRISQPLLSLHLKGLEEALGLSLFEFKGKKKILNSSGKGSRIYPSPFKIHFWIDRPKGI